MSFGVLFGKPLDRVRDDKLQNVDERIDEVYIIRSPTLVFNSDFFRQEMLGLPMFFRPLFTTIIITIPCNIKTI